MASESSQGVSLIVGLGNPGAQYARTRHNVGFWLVDRLGAGLRADAKYHAEIGAATIDGERVVLMKPLTFMNRSGQAVGAYARFFKIAPAQILVVHDELDLAPGTVRLKQGGGHGGHNGLRDISAQLGADYRRLRIGIGHPRDLYPGREVVDFVLQRPARAERQAIDERMAAALGVVPMLAAGQWERAGQTLHTVPRAT